jgi:hypothetical protein
MIVMYLKVVLSSGKYTKLKEYTTAMDKIRFFGYRLNLSDIKRS